ncbi:UTP--glucose-1-phosphate uridylyltransferase [Prosthecobacter sp.]|uniref:UTP--glucose-1-phosphate uridylyltransferase n=1 Tax=Prosthecobacter sp. TaxID=1965333 RepID=UPI002ABBC60D|nr:UTP--glucose-1-phosphate uridylyltransferase [Prosthecobacter sp.]MDZ4405896.1 UTP--glucose-1-phosphate uridylyltransferase [Prosthecobacter sp.]
MSNPTRTPESIETSFTSFRQKMQAAGLSESAIRAFRGSYAALLAGETGMIPEATIAPAKDLPCADALMAPDAGRASELLKQTVLIKLNGGLGTGMGLEKAKSLLPVRGEDTFLDLIARQILRLRAQTGGAVPVFMLMNSFSTSADTTAHLAARFPQLGGRETWELMQNKVPKVLAGSLEPATWPANPDQEWCPPGHGDIYACLVGSGWLERLLGGGVRYAFVSNSDNLGATLDPSILAWFADSGMPFAMEVTRRTESDKKGGHLAVRLRDGRFLLRESAQCPKDDESHFQNIDRHRYFNTNNLWIDLQALKTALDANDGLIPLPPIMNKKTVDPRDGSSPPVIQVETAMGAAIECFQGAGAIEVSRTRFAPVKTTSDLLAVRSDAYELTEDFCLRLHPSRNGQPPHLHLDAKLCKLVDGLEQNFPHTPSLLHCRSLLMHGPVECGTGVIFKGDVVIHNHTNASAKLKAGVHEGQMTVD